MGNENWDKEEKNKRWRSQKRIRLIRFENNKNAEKSTDFVKKTNKEWRLFWLFNLLLKN